MKNRQFIVLCLLILLQPIIIYCWWWYRIEYIFYHTSDIESRFDKIDKFMENSEIFMNNIDDRTWGIKSWL
jgi:hypothetical protein